MVAVEGMDWLMDYPVTCTSFVDRADYALSLKKRAIASHNAAESSQARRLLLAEVAEAAKVAHKNIKAHRAKEKLTEIETAALKDTLSASIKWDDRLSTEVSIG